jgi:hypothetical protein
MDHEVPVPRPGETSPRRRPRYVLGTFWLLIGIAGFFSGFSADGHIGLLLGPLLIAYAVYLYRGGRFGLILW